MKSKNTCDCTVLHIQSSSMDSDFIKISNVKPVLNYLALCYNMGCNVDKIKPKDFIDGRRGLSTVFRFCPYCGKKITKRMLNELLQ